MNHRTIGSAMNAIVIVAIARSWSLAGSMLTNCCVAIASPLESRAHLGCYGGPRQQGRAERPPVVGVRHLRSCEARLRRLQTDRIGLYQMHRVDRSTRLHESDVDYSSHGQAVADRPSPDVVIQLVRGFTVAPPELDHHAVVVRQR